VHLRAEVGSNGLFSHPQSLEIVVAPYDDFRSLSLEEIHCVWACTVGNEDGALDTKPVGNTGNSDSCITPRCCYYMKAVSTLRFTPLDEERDPPILERLRGLEVLGGSAHKLAKKSTANTSSFRYASIPMRWEMCGERKSGVSR